MKSLSQKKLKRILQNKLVERELRVPDYRREKTQLQYFSSDCVEVQENMCEVRKEYDVIPGEYREPDPDIIDIAFSHTPGLTKKSKKCLLNSGVHTALGGIDEEQEWTEWWEEHQVSESFKSDKISPADINALKQKYSQHF